MAENEDGQERSERATPKRQEDARRKGQVPRSRELNTMVITVASAAMLLMSGPGMLDQLAGIMRDGLRLDRSMIFDHAAPAALLAGTVLKGFAVIAPFLLMTVVAAVGASIALGGWSFSLEALAFSPDKLNPVNGFKRMFSVRGLVELAKALVKFLLIGAVAVALLWHLSGQFLGLGHEAPKQALAHAGHLLGWNFLSLSLVLILIAAADVPYQLWEHGRQLRMTKQEVKDEYKDTEGKPEIKSKIRARQQEIATRRMMEEVPKADVVVTNPTHFAVALRYDPDNMRAPKVVAKGADLIAAQIRNVAARHKVTTVSAPPLARALYHSTRIDREIPAGLYLAVAQVLAYVFQLKAARQEGGQTPSPPTDLPVPAEYEKGRPR